MNVRFHINQLAYGQVEIVIIVNEALHTITRDLKEALKIVYELGKNDQPS